MGILLNNTVESAQFMEFLFDNISSAVFIVDKEMKVKKVNNSYKNLFNKEEKEVINELCGNSLGCAFAVEQGVPCGSTTECKSCSIRKSVLKNNFDLEDIKTIYVTRKFYINEEAVFKYFRIKIKDMIYNGEDVSIITIDDITELEEQKEKIKEMANLDYLTKLYNRRYFFEVAQKFFENASRGLINLAIVMIDIDYFKKVNDNYGHGGGDFILASFGDILRENLRNADIICRYGGEEFCILLVLKEKDDAYNIIEKVRKLVENKEFLYDNVKIPVTISSGICTNLEDSIDKMINKADDMLYKAKNTGRNRVIMDNLEWGDKMKYFLGLSFLFFTFLIFANNNKIISKKTVEKTGIFKNISAEEMKKIISEREVIILDIRTLEEFRQGHIKEAINIDFYSKNFENDLDKLDKTKTYIIYCRSGNRSGTALKTMEKLKFVEVYNVLGGIGSIGRIGYPLVK